MIAIPAFFIIFFTATSPSFKQKNAHVIYIFIKNPIVSSLFPIGFIFQTDTFIFYHDLITSYIKLFAQR
ncbi:hypothetical protein JL52_14240 [Listeria ivanovii subsp. ivanovii]|nr:hypothetical protein JL52_14240 [Listeria ivanovii subsp. ivanovii]